MPRPKKTKEKSTRKERKPREKKLKVAKVKNNVSFFEALGAATENELATAASNGIAAGDINGWIDTGVLLLNAQLSGSMYGGIPNNKISVFAGLEGVGKTYFVLALIKHFLDTNPTGGVMFFESESAISKKMLDERGIDTARVIIVPVSTIQEWRTQSLKVLAKYKDSPNKPPMMYCLDSLGMLSTTKEMQDSESGSEKADMTRARLIKAAFRTITLKLGVLGVPFIVTNHTYETQGLFSKKVQSGGCLVAGTKVIIDKGHCFDFIETKNIEEIEISDKVVTLFGNKPVLNTFQFAKKDVFKITLENDEVIECSGDHKFLVNGRWIDTYQLFDNLNVVSDINISDVTGDIDVFREQIQNNLL